MTGQELKQRGFLYFDTVREGFDGCGHEIVKMNGEEAFRLFSELTERYGKENSFLDFYLFKLKKEEREKAGEIFSPKEKKLALCLEERYKEENGVIFPMDSELLSLAVRLNETQMLFSTMYFKKGDENGGEAETWWGNYNGEYIKFWRKNQKEGC